jgi:1-acyl-sn-glycerol-3-phosphate acyltransferase
MTALVDEVNERIERLELPFNSAGVDPFGVSKAHLRQAGVALGSMYRHYFSIRCFGAENIPKRGRAMLVANHSGGYAVDAGMLAAACFFELDPPRLAHGMAEKFLSQVPFLSQWTHRIGQLSGLPEHARMLLRQDRLLMVFPEGTRGTAKLYTERYSLVRFGTGFVRLAMETQTPIIPVAVLGGGEAIPTIANSKFLGKLLGAPYLPITPYLFALPLPVKMEIRFGAPITFTGTGEEADATVNEMVESVKARIGEQIEEGRKEYSPV